MNVPPRRAVEPAVCAWLRRPTHDIDQLRQRFTIFVQEHGALRLLCYDSARSPHTTLANQCRGLVVDAAHDWRAVCWGMDRFFHDGVERDWQPRPPLRVEDKEDGSFILMFHYAGRWQACTRHTFLDVDRRYLELALEASGCPSLGVLAERMGLAEGMTACFELCSPENRIIRQYDQPLLFLLGVYTFVDHTPLSDDQLDAMAARAGQIQRPAARLDCDSLEEARRLLTARMGREPLFEGFVVRDADDRRLKLKSPRYHLFHQLKYRSWARATPRLLVPFILRDQSDDLLGTLSRLLPARELREFQARCARYALRIDEELDALEGLWAQIPHNDRRSAAAQIRASAVPTAHLLLRIYGEPNPSDWRTLLLFHLSRTLREMFPDGQDTDPTALMLDDHPPTYGPPPQTFDSTEIAPVPPEQVDGVWQVTCACGAQMDLLQLPIDRVRYRRCHCGKRFGMHVYAKGTWLWVCPVCDGSHEAHQRTQSWPGEGITYQQGQPLGIPATARGKALRLQVHDRLVALRHHHRFDRSAAYQWLSQALKLPRAQTHVALFTAQRCAEAIRLIEAALEDH